MPEANLSHPVPSVSEAAAARTTDFVVCSSLGGLITGFAGGDSNFLFDLSKLDPSGMSSLFFEDFRIEKQCSTVSEKWFRKSILSGRRKRFSGTGCEICSERKQPQKPRLRFFATREKLNAMEWNVLRKHSCTAPNRDSLEFHCNYFIVFPAPLLSERIPTLSAAPLVEDGNWGNFRDYSPASILKHSQCSDGPIFEKHIDLSQAFFVCPPSATLSSDVRRTSRLSFVGVHFNGPENFGIRPGHTKLIPSKLRQEKHGRNIGEI